MNAELFIHGPRHAFYGNQDEYQYCQSFDNGQVKDEIRFVVEIRKSGKGETFAYYNYCRYANVFDVDGRGGAYIGLTIRLDSYYTNLRNIYTILDAIFNAKVVGLLVKRISAGYQYLVSTFKNSQDDILNKVEKSVGIMLMQILSPNEVVSIDSTFTLMNGELVKSMDDNTFSDICLADIRRYGRLVFSSSKKPGVILQMYNKFNQEKETYIKSLKTAREQYQKERDVYNSKIQELKKTVIDRDSQLSFLENELNNLRSKVDSLERDKRSLISRVNSLENCNNNINQQKGNDNIGKTDDTDDKTNRFHGFRKIMKKLGLKEGPKAVVSFFLVLVAVIVGNSTYNFLQCEKSEDISDSPEGDEESKVIEREGQQPTRKLTIPNALTERYYPNMQLDAVMSYEIIGKKAGRCVLLNLTPNKHDASVNYEWSIRNVTSDITDTYISSCCSLGYKPREDGDYIVQIFVRDTLIAEKTFKF